MKRPLRVRTVFLWTHLVLGLLAGLVIAVMSSTGIVIAFEQEILDFIDRDARTVEVPEGAAPRDLAELLEGLSAVEPDFSARSVVIPADPAAAYLVSGGKDGSRFVDPYTGEVRRQPSEGAHEVLHFIEDVHRFLALEGVAKPVGKMVTGVGNLIFVFLCLSGIYLWFPRNWARKALRPLVVLVRTRGDKARHFNQHNVFGVWSVLVLLVIAGSGVVISFPWAHELVFRVAGEEPPKERGFRMMAVPDEPFATPEEGQAPITHAELVDTLAARFPEREAIVVDLAPREPERPIHAQVILPDLFTTRGRVFVQVDPYRGEVLRAVSFGERSAGLRARVWLRFLHTGEAFGLVGKVAATLASAASLVLVYTGVMLSIHRFFRKGRRRRAQAPMIERKTSEVGGLAESPEVP